MHNKLRNMVIISMITLLISHCASYDFRNMRVEQGNLLPQKKVDQVRVGMTKQQVASIMGDTLTDATFTENRWDYAYTFRIGNGPMTKKHAIFYFRNGKVTRKSIVLAQNPKPAA